MFDSFFWATSRFCIYFNSPSILLIRRHPCNVSIFRRTIFNFNWSTLNFVFARKNSLPYLRLTISATSRANGGARYRFSLKALGGNSASHSSSTISWAWLFLILASSSFAACLYIALFLVATSTKTSQTQALGRGVQGGELPAILTWGGSVRSSSDLYICTSKLIWLRSKEFSLMRIKALWSRVIS